MTSTFSASSPDQELDEVEAALRLIPHLEEKLIDGVARAVDEVVDPVRSARWRITDLDQPEKTVIGIRVENVLRMDLELERSDLLDMKINGVDVDVKFTIHNNWAIPPEAENHICLVTQFNEQHHSVSAGLIRTTPEVLNIGRNRDRKTSISKTGKNHIRWLVNGAVASSSIIGFMARLDENTRMKITDPQVGAQVRQNRLFTLVPNRPIPEALVEAISQHKDWTRRLRPDATNPNAPGEEAGYDVLRQSSHKDRAWLLKEGKPPLKPGFCLSVLTSEDMRTRDA